MGPFKARKRMAVLGAIVALPALGLAAPSLAQASLAMLASLDSGAWEVRFRDGSPSRKLCVRSGREFIQLRHPSPGCSRVVIDDSSSEVTVQYTCPGKGYGRTNIRKETHGLVQIESNGVAGGKPFQLTAEARASGACQS